jgi:glucose dehydrogenase
MTFAEEIPMQSTNPKFRYRSRPVVFAILCFELVTLSAGIWGWKTGVPFWEVVPSSFVLGIVGGTAFSVGIIAFRTGLMYRYKSSYRFSERPALFIMDSVLILTAIAFCAIFPIAYTVQEQPQQSKKANKAQMATPRKLSD